MNKHYTLGLIELMVMQNLVFKLSTCFALHSNPCDATPFALCDVLVTHDGLDDALVTRDVLFDVHETCDVLGDALWTFDGQKRFYVLDVCDDQSHHVGCDARVTTHDDNRLFGFDTVPVAIELVQR